MKLNPCFVEWADVKSDCQLDADDDNGGLIYGIEWEDSECQIVDAEWFATSFERLQAVKKIFKTNFHIAEDASDYKDLDLYVENALGEEWYLRVFIDKADNTLVTCEPRYAASKKDDFETYDNYPLEVYNEVQRVMPLVSMMLRTDN